MSEEDCFSSWYAAKLGKVRRMERLLRRDGFDVDERDETFGRSPLHFACKYGHAEIVHMLLSGGVRVDAKDQEEYTPLHFAAGWGSTTIIELLLCNSANPGMRNKNGRTPIQIAAKLGRNDNVALLDRWSRPIDDSNSETLFGKTMERKIVDDDEDVPEQVQEEEQMSSSLLKQLRVLGLKEKMHGKKHEKLIPTLVKVAHEYRSVGQYEQAAPLLYRALCITESARGANSRFVVIALNNLAETYHKLKRYADAEVLLRRARSVISEFSSEEKKENNIFRKILRNLALAYLAQDKPADAAECIEVAVHEAEPSEDLSSYLVVLGYAHERDENLKASIDVYERVLKMCNGDEDLRVNVSEHLARVELCSNHFDRAETLFRFVCDERKRSLGESHPKTRLAARNLAIAIGGRVVTDDYDDTRTSAS